MALMAARSVCSCLTSSVNPIIWAAIVVMAGVWVGSESSISSGLHGRGHVLARCRLEGEADHGGRVRIGEGAAEGALNWNPEGPASGFDVEDQVGVGAPGLL